MDIFQKCADYTLADDIKGKKYYIPGNNKNERAAQEYWSKIKNNNK